MDVSAEPEKLIYFEKQQGLLCAVHCLNNLLQGPLFNAAELANFADELDEAERMSLAEGGQNSEDYRKFLESPSQNKDDTGFFSIQVIEKALSNLNLEMIPLSSKSSEMAVRIQENPTAAQAFICNFREHWLTIRKFGSQWINLNSMLSKPKPLTDTYLSLYLRQLQTEGYSIYIINGDLIQTDADKYLAENPLPAWYFVEPPPPRRVSRSSPTSAFVNVPDEVADNDTDFQNALAESYLNVLEDEQRQLSLALELSLQQQSSSSSN